MWQAVNTSILKELAHIFVLDQKNPNNWKLSYQPVISPEVHKHCEDGKTSFSKSCNKYLMIPSVITGSLIADK